MYVTSETFFKPCDRRRKAAVAAGDSDGDGIVMAEGQACGSEAGLAAAGMTGREVASGGSQ